MPVSLRCEEIRVRETERNEKRKENDDDKSNDEINGKGSVYAQSFLKRRLQVATSTASMFFNPTKWMQQSFFYLHFLQYKAIH